MNSAVGAAIASSFLGALPPRLIDAVCARAKLHNIAAGQVFVDETTPDWVGIMVSGLARVSINPPVGAEFTVRYVRPGSAVGVAALAGAEHPVNIRAVTRCQVLQLPFKVVRSIVEMEPDAGRAVARELAARLFDTYAELATQVRGTVRQRLAGHMLEVADESAEHALNVNRTHADLADAIGSAREVVSKTLETFAREGIVQLSRGRIHILGTAQLHQVAQGTLGSPGADPARRQHELGSDD